MSSTPPKERTSKEFLVSSRANKQTNSRNHPSSSPRPLDQDYLFGRRIQNWTIRNRQFPHSLVMYKDMDRQLHILSCIHNLSDPQHLLPIIHNIQAHNPLSHAARQPRCRNACYTTLLSSALIKLRRDTALPQSVSHSVSLSSLFLSTVPRQDADESPLSILELPYSQYLLQSDM